ncbi:MAG: Uma2 family endonuclease [Cytophagales bacterium]
MEAAVIENPVKKPKAIKKMYGSERIVMSYEAYDNFEPKNGIKYEWKNGFAIKNGFTMKNTERYIVSNINRKFINTTNFRTGGELFPETRCKLNDSITRIPDLAFFSKEQIKLSAQDQHPIPSFVIEIISKNENTLATEEKVKEYFEAGVASIWHIFPTLKQVWVFSTNKTIAICTDADICTAKNALIDFSITVDEIFKISE